MRTVHENEIDFAAIRPVVESRRVAVKLDDLGCQLRAVKANARLRLIHILAIMEGQRQSRLIHAAPGEIQRIDACIGAAVGGEIQRGSSVERADFENYPGIGKLDELGNDLQLLRRDIAVHGVLAAPEPLREDRRGSDPSLALRVAYGFPHPVARQVISKRGRRSVATACGG